MATDRSELRSSIRRKVRRAIIEAAPSEVEEIVRSTVAKTLVGVVEKEAVISIVGRVASGLDAVAESLIGGTIEPRATMYGDAIWSTHETQVLERERDEGITLGRRICEADGASCDECVAAATEELVPLDELDEIGSLQCLNNCRCEFSFSVDGAEEFATSELFSGVISGQERYGGDVELN